VAYGLWRTNRDSRLSLIPLESSPSQRTAGITPTGDAVGVGQATEIPCGRNDPRCCRPSRGRKLTRVSQTKRQGIDLFDDPSWDSQEGRKEAAAMTGWP